MNWIYNHKRALLHVNLAFIGGLTGAYAILVRGGNFGAAQTMNLIEMVLNFTEMNLTDAFLRLAIFILYGRSEERRVGKECPYRCRSRWSPYH